MTYSVEYRLNNYEDSNTPNVLPFNSVDEALHFINKIKESFKDCLEYVFIHCL